MLAATVWGTFPQWVIVTSLLIAAATFTRGSRSTAITNLRTERDEYERECRAQAAEIAALRATRDLEPVQRALLDAIAQHESLADARSAKTLAALDRHLDLTEMIAQRLGPNHAD